MGFTKLFSDILCSSVWNEDDKTRIVWITLLALRGPNNVARGSIDGLAHQARVSIEDCEKAVTKLSSPDQHSGDPEFDGRRIEKVPHGWLILNGEKYRVRKDGEDRKEYMNEYMRQYRRKQSVNNRKQCKQNVNVYVNKNVNNVNKKGQNVNPSLSSLHSSLLSTDQNKEKSSLNASKQPIQAALQIGLAPVKTPEKKQRSGPLMNEESVERFKANPAYSGIDVDKETWKFGEWCRTNGKLETVRRFTNWLNRVA